MTILCREGDNEGINTNINACETGTSIAQLQHAFETSPEYQACEKCKNDCLVAGTIILHIIFAFTKINRIIKK